MMMQRVEQIRSMNEQVIPKVIKNIEKYKEQMISCYDKKAKEKTYAVNGSVMMENHHIQEQGKALLTQWLGSFKIVEVLKNNKHLLSDDDLKLLYPVHADQLKLYKSRPRLATTLAFYSQARQKNKEGKLCGGMTGTFVTKKRNEGELNQLF